MAKETGWSYGSLGDSPECVNGFRSTDALIGSDKCGAMGDGCGADDAVGGVTWITGGQARGRGGDGGRDGQNCEIAFQSRISQGKYFAGMGFVGVSPSHRIVTTQ
jgi:hypothetical protein